MSPEYKAELLTVANGGASKLPNHPLTGSQLAKPAHSAQNPSKEILGEMGMFRQLTGSIKDER